MTSHKCFFGHIYLHLLTDKYFDRKYCLQKDDPTTTKVESAKVAHCNRKSFNCFVFDKICRDYVLIFVLET